VNRKRKRKEKREKRIEKEKEKSFFSVKLLRLCDQTKVNKFNLECVPESKTHTKTKKKKTIKRKHIDARK
jgi:hypothetical protein